MNVAYYTTVSTLESLVNTDNPYWNIDRATGELLQDTIISHGYTSILEIGTSNGLSALYMAAAVVQTGGHITTVESHTERFNLATAHFEAAQVQYLITQIKGHAPEILDTVPGTFDCIFIDATSLEYKSYFMHLTSRLRIGGSFLADNVISHQEKIQPFIDAISSDTNFLVSIIDIGKGILVAKKIQ